jgi:TonB family protein
MSHKNLGWAVVACALGLMTSPASRADLYQAEAALQKQDLPRAFSLYRELAELGHGGAQENLAIMYVNGEGVARDNVLGYAWAKLALENGAGDAAKAIVSQIEPHLKDAMRARVADIEARFGNAALRKSILPVMKTPAEFAAAVQSGGTACRMRAPADPDLFYPEDAKRQGISGTVLVEARVWPDGSARTPRVWYSFPAEAFDAPGRAVALSSQYRPMIENGVPVACSVLFKVKFRMQSGADVVANAETRKIAADLEAKALAGDPASQLAYGVILSMFPELNEDGEKVDTGFVKAAQAGIPSAQYLVALQLMYGGWCKKDEVKGRFWLERAANAGSVDAQSVLGSHLLRASADAASRDQGFAWLQRAASSSHREAKFLFSSLLVSWPDASRRDPAKALALLAEIRDTFEYDPAFHEIRAAALAAHGDFKAAVGAQKRAVGAARNLKWDTAREKVRLEAYEKGQLADGELISF